MEIANIKNIDRNDLRFQLLKAISDSRFEGEIELRGSKALKVANIRLKERKPYCGNHPNACEIGARMMNGKWLEGADWVSFNDMLNDVCDKLEVKCSIRSAGIVWIRRGANRRINYGSHIRGNFYQWDYLGDETDWEDYIGRNAPDSSYPWGTPGLYKRTDLNVEV